MPCVKQDTVEEEEEYDQPVVYYSGIGVFLQKQDDRWQSRGVGTFGLLRNSEGAFVLAVLAERTVTGGRRDPEDWQHGIRASNCCRRTDLALA